MNPLVSAVVVNHNRAELLGQCLRSLLKQTYDSFEILVVDNASSDHSRDLLGSFQHERLRLIALDQNVGFAGGNNVAIREARGEFVALLNNDAVATEGWIEHLVAVMQSSGRIGMCTSKILFFQTDVIDKAGHLMYPDGQNRGRGTGEKDRGQYDELEETLFADGCAALYRKLMLDELGGFDESFFAYGDDADLGIRGRLMGWKSVYVPEAVVYHRHSSTIGPYAPQKVFWVERNRFWLALKNFPLPLLFITPALTLNRWMWNFCAALARRGAAGHFRQESSLWVLLRTLGRAYGSGFRHAGEMLQKRRKIRKTRRTGDLEFYRLLLRFRISARTLAFQDSKQTCQVTRSRELVSFCGERDGH